MNHEHEYHKNPPPFDVMLMKSDLVYYYVSRHKSVKGPVPIEKIITHVSQGKHEAGDKWSVDKVSWNHIESFMEMVHQKSNASDENPKTELDKSKPEAHHTKSAPKGKKSGRLKGQQGKQVTTPSARRPKKHSAGQRTKQTGAKGGLVVTMMAILLLLTLGLCRFLEVWPWEIMDPDQPLASEVENDNAKEKAMSNHVIEKDSTSINSHPIKPDPQHFEKKRDERWSEINGKNASFNLNSNGLSITKGKKAHVIQSSTHLKDGGTCSLRPKDKTLWDFSSMRSVGWRVINYGRHDVKIYIQLKEKKQGRKKGKIDGMGIIEPGEEVLVGCGLPRGAKDSPAEFGTMSGLPTGEFKHWNHIDLSQVEKIDLQLSSKAEIHIELSSAFWGNRLDTKKITDETWLPFIDAFGQYVHHDWKDKVLQASELRVASKGEAEFYEQRSPTNDFSDFGGWKKGERVDGTGHFSTRKIKGKWWLIDPEGYPFWSHGVNGFGIDGSITPIHKKRSSAFEVDPMLNLKSPFVKTIKKKEKGFLFYQNNIALKYGQDWKELAWAKTLERFQSIGLNTAGGFSPLQDHQQKKVPYTPVLYTWTSRACDGVSDPFDPEFKSALDDKIGTALKPLNEDPYCLGVFIDNEIYWTNSSKSLVLNVLTYKKDTHGKKALVEQLKDKYKDISALNTHWNSKFSSWKQLMNTKSAHDFSGLPSDVADALAYTFAHHYYEQVAEAMRTHAPNKLYMGSRMHNTSKAVAQAAAQYVDVLSLNHYEFQLHLDKVGVIDKPMLISEFHFGSLGKGNLGGGLKTVIDDQQQGRVYEHYLNQCIQDPRVVGAHWFLWIDQCVGGRRDGENYRVGVVDITDQTRLPLATSMRKVANSLYEQRWGE